jgi:hypothetical protein
MGGQSLKPVGEWSHRFGAEALDQKRTRDFIRALLQAPGVRVGPGSSVAIKQHVTEGLSKAGWAMPVRLDDEHEVELNALRDGVVLQVQTGNMARAFYDLMKIESVYLSGRASCGVLILPSTQGARLMGDNIANFERISGELAHVFFHQVTCPILLVAFE